MIDDGFERAWFREEVAGAWDNFQGFRTAQAGEGLLVKFDNAIIGTTHYQKRWRVNPIKDIASKIRATAARHNCFNCVS